MIKVLIADDETLFIEGIKRIIESDSDLKVTGIAKNGAEAVQLCKDGKPDIVLMDIQMPVMDGIEATRLIKQYDRNIKVLILTTFCEDKNIINAVQNRCDGFILKEVSDLEKFNLTIKDTCKGLRILNDEVFSRLIYKNVHVSAIEQTSSLEGYNLTDREIEVIRHITAGRKNSEIADVLFISEGTVKNHITTILEKLQLRNCKELAVWGARHGL